MAEKMHDVLADDALCDLLAGRASDFDSDDPALACLQTLTSDVDERPLPALQYRLRTDSFTRRKYSRRARTAAVLALGAMASTTGISAAVTGNPLRPWRFAVTHVVPFHIDRPAKSDLGNTFDGAGFPGQRTTAATSTSDITTSQAPSTAESSQTQRSTDQGQTSQPPVPSAPRSSTSANKPSDTKPPTQNGTTPATPDGSQASIGGAVTFHQDTAPGSSTTMAPTATSSSAPTHSSATTQTPSAPGPTVTPPAPTSTSVTATSPLPHPQHPHHPKPKPSSPTLPGPVDPSPTSGTSTSSSPTTSSPTSTPTSSKPSHTATSTPSTSAHPRPTRSQTSKHH